MLIPSSLLVGKLSRESPCALRRRGAKAPSWGELQGMASCARERRATTAELHSNELLERLNL